MYKNADRNFLLMPTETFSAVAMGKTLRCIAKKRKVNKTRC